MMFACLLAGLLAVVLCFDGDLAGGSGKEEKKVWTQTVYTCTKMRPRGRTGLV